MTTHTHQHSRAAINDNKPPIADIRQIISSYLYHWPLFVISLLLMFGAAFIWLKFTKPVYEVKAVLLIKDEKKAPDQQSALHEIDLLSTSKITENEVEVLKSKDIISQVVQDLQLNVEYQQKDGLVYKALYKDSPVKLTLIDAPDLDDDKISLVIKDKTSFSLITPDGEPKTILFKDSFKTEFGTFKVNPTSYLMDHKGETIRIILNDLDKVALKYQTSIDATLPDKLATAISLSIKDPIALRGKDILNRLIYDYKNAGNEDKQRETKKTLDFIDQRLASLTGELNNSEKGISDFKSSRGLTDISSQSKISLENLQVNDNHLNEANLQLNVIEGIERYVNSSENTGKAPTTLGITDPALTSLISKLVDLQLQRERLLATTPETNPDFEVIDNQIKSTRSAIKESVASMKESILGTRNKLQTFDSKIESSIRDIPTQEREYVSKKRQQATKESLYTYLLQKREEVAVSYASTLANDRIVDQAYAGPAKKPQKPVVLALAFILALAIPSTVLYRKKKGKLMDVQQIETVVDFPIVSELPYEATKTSIAVSHDNITATSEQFRALRVKLKYLSQEQSTGVVTLITSSVPGEGKSFVSSNLAASLAYSGKKTIILELDMRKPKIAKTFNLQNEVGISDYLNGSATLAKVVQRSALGPNLDVISSGSVVKAPLELLEKDGLKMLIDNLKEKYDEIVIDSPPVRLVADALVLAPLADITLYVIRQGITDKAELNFLNELVHQKQLTNVNLIFNGIRRDKYGYGYNYSQARYYDKNENSRLTNVLSNFADRL